MKINLGDVLPYALATRALLDANAAGVKGYESLIADPWEGTTFAAQIAAVEGMVATGGLMGLNKEDTRLRNGYLNDLRPILRDLTYKVRKCIKNGSIGDGYASFYLGAFKDSITQKDINGCQLAYTATMARIGAGGNAAALNAVGFTTSKQAAITTNFDLAWGVQMSKVSIKLSISELSAANQVIVKALLGSCAMVIKAIRAYAESVGNVDLIRKATQRAVLSTVRRAKPVGSVDRNIGQNESICWLVGPAGRDLLQFTLLTPGGSACVCRMATKAGVCGSGTVLVYGVMLSVKKAFIPGVGDCIIITNTGGKGIKVRVLRVKG